MELWEWPDLSCLPVSITNSDPVSPRLCLTLNSTLDLPKMQAKAKNNRLLLSTLASLWLLIWVVQCRMPLISTSSKTSIGLLWWRVFSSVTQARRKINLLSSRSLPIKWLTSLDVSLLTRLSTLSSIPVLPSLWSPPTTGKLTPNKSSITSKLNNTSSEMEPSLSSVMRDPSSSPWSSWYPLLRMERE